jgi:hypothetical protein
MKNPEIKTFITVSDAPDACVFIVGRQHHTYKKLYSLTYYTANGEVDAGWNDCSLFKTPTQEQLEDIDNRLTAQHA